MRKEEAILPLFLSYVPVLNALNNWNNLSIPVKSLGQTTLSPNYHTEVQIKTS